VVEQRAARYRDVFANQAFQAVWCARLLSTAGDQIARVALSVLVLDRTRSVVLAALAFALSFLPALFGSLLAGWLGAAITIGVAGAAATAGGAVLGAYWQRIRRTVPATEPSGDAVRVG
jgi:MFS family permease